MATIPIKVTSQGKTQDMEISTNPGGFTVLVHQQGIKVTVPTFVEVSARTTLQCMSDMTQKQWTWISTGGVFKHLWKMAFDPNQKHGSVGEYIPETITELNDSDPGMVHVAGMIIQGCEAMMAGRSVFFRNPEDLLHPATERYIVGMFHEMLKLFGSGSGGEVKAVAEAPANTEEAGSIKATPIDQLPPINKSTYAQDKAECLKWLSLHEPGSPIAKLGNTIITCDEVIPAVESDKPFGQSIVSHYVKQRDAKLKREETQSHEEDAVPGT